MDRVFKLYENYFVFRKTHPDWSDTREFVLERCKQLIRIGFIYPLMSTGSEGQKIVLLNHGKFDNENFSVDEIFPLLFHGISIFLEDQKTQICGIDLICNYSGVTLKYISSFSMKQHLNFVQFGLNSTPGRFKKIYIVNLPSFANHVIFVAKMAMTEKMKNRLITVKNMEKLSNFMDVKSLPEEFGGEISEHEIIKDFIDTFESSIERLKTTNSFELDLEKSTIETADNIGSFRKLEID